MSRAQGDGFRTHTDHELNAYKWRLRAKLQKLIDHKEKWYRVGKGWILAEEYNRMENPNGSWKWNGWTVEAREYKVTVFPAECVEIKDGKPNAIGWAVVTKIIRDDKEAANEYFTRVAKPLAKDLATWIPKAGTEEADNTPMFRCEGMVPKALIAIDWEGDAYFYSLIVDGAEVMRSHDKLELKGEAERIGAELEETHAVRRGRNYRWENLCRYQ